MTSQMVSRFRVKKLSPKHPLPVYKESQLPDLADPSNLQRSVPQIETGVEKEEEEEHDLQAAISAAQAAVTTGAQIERYIPTPDASRTIDTKAFNRLYSVKFKEPSTLIRFSSTVEDCTGCQYVMDEEDNIFMKKFKAKHRSKSITEDQFETIMWELESITKRQLPHLSADPSQLPDIDAFHSLVPPDSGLLSQPGFDDIFEHWRQRRSRRAGKSIIPTLQYEDIVKNEVDPYVCFRRRESKSVRKTRRTDQQSLERLRRLRAEMEMARNLLEMVLKREKVRKESLVLEQAVFEKKCTFREYQRILGIKEDEDLLSSVPRKKRKGLSTSVASGTTIKIPLNKLKRDGLEDRLEKTPMQLAIEAELLRKKEQDSAYEDITECPYQCFPRPTPQLFYQYFFPANLATSGRPKFRKRLGRNGRLFLDRTGYHCESKENAGGKSNLFSLKQHIARQIYRFDTDNSSDEGDDSDEEREGGYFDGLSINTDYMQDSCLQRRSQLLSESDLRSLVTIPFSGTPHNIINLQDTAIYSATVPSVSNQPKTASSSDENSQNYVGVSSSLQSHSIAVNVSPIPSSLSSTSSTVNSNNTETPPVHSPVGIKRQNSRNRMTPQQASVAMANEMMVANMAAAVHHSGQSKSSVQLAMAAATQQRQQQQQQQQHLHHLHQQVVTPFAHQ